MENRGRFIIDLAKRCKELCGKDFFVEIQLTAVEKNSYGIGDTIEFCKLAEVSCRCARTMAAMPTPRATTLLPACT